MAATGILNPSNQTNITVRVDNSIPTSGVDNWRTAVQSAITAWNGINDTRLSFTYTTSSTAMVTIRADGSPYTTLIDGMCALAEPPSGSGVISPIIYLNLDALSNRTFTEDEKIWTIAHELGHQVGMRHTNWADLSEGIGDAVLISGTPDNDDIFSVFRGGVIGDWGDSWRRFTSYDSIAIQTIYPNMYVEISGPSYFGGDCPTAQTQYTATGYDGSGGTYTYHDWYISTGSGGYLNWSYQGNGQSIYKSFNYDDYIKLRVMVTNGSDTAYGYRFINNICR